MGKPAERSRLVRRSLIAAAVGGLTLCGAGLAVILYRANPHGGEPYAVLAVPPAKPVAASDGSSSGVGPPAPAPGAAVQTGQRNIENGVSIVRAGEPAQSHGNGPLVINVPQALGLSEIAATDKHLIEMSRYGPLPKIGADGAVAREIYARPAVFGPALPPAAPRIALYIEGVGGDALTTASAIAELPPAVSLAFTPYGAALDASVKRAKAAGHEVLLELPMDSFGDEQDHAAPHRLRVSATQGETVDDLHWLMSRISGYVGVTSYFGGRFTADSPAMTTMLKEIGARGLLYVEDGSSKHSLGATLATSLAVPAGQADVVVDATTDRRGLDAALARLEGLARANGSAIAVAVDRPDVIAPLARFAKGLQDKGIALVPVSALINGRPPVTAAAP